MRAFVFRLSAIAAGMVFASSLVSAKKNGGPKNQGFEATFENALSIRGDGHPDPYPGTASEGDILRIDTRGTPGRGKKPGTPGRDVILDFGNRYSTACASDGTPDFDGDAALGTEALVKARLVDGSWLSPTPGTHDGRYTVCFEDPGGDPDVSWCVRFNQDFQSSGICGCSDNVDIAYDGSAWSVDSQGMGIACVLRDEFGSVTNYGYYQMPFQMTVEPS